MIEHPKYKRGNIYLSGSMEYAPDGELGGTWRKELSSKLKEIGYFPLDITALDHLYTEHHGNLFDPRSILVEGEVLQRKSNIRKHFVETDLRILKESTDAVVILYDEGVRRGAGTISECQVAFNLDIPIFLVNAFEDRSNIPGWLFSLTTKIFDNFEDLMEYLRGLPDGIICRDQYGNRRAGQHYLCSLCGDPFEKSRHHYVSKVSPTYCKPCVDLVTTTNEGHKDRFEFFVEYFKENSEC